MSLFKHRKTVHLLDGKQVAVGTPGAKKSVISSKKWYARVKFEDGRIKNVPLSNDKTAARQMHADLMRKIERRKAGIETAEDEGSLSPIKPLLDAYARHLRSKGNVDTYTELVSTRLEAIMDGCSFAMPKDIQAGPFLKWLEETAVKEELSQTTQQYYRKHLKSFVVWLLKNGKLTRDPLISLDSGVTITKFVVIRREILPGEMASCFGRRGRASTRTGVSTAGRGAPSTIWPSARACGSGQSLRSECPTSIWLAAPRRSHSRSRTTNRGGERRNLYRLSSSR
jgi:hypothetical protein